MLQHGSDSVFLPFRYHFMKKKKKLCSLVPAVSFKYKHKQIFSLPPFPVLLGRQPLEEFHPSGELRGGEKK